MKFVLTRLPCLFFQEGTMSPVWLDTISLQEVLHPLLYLRGEKRRGSVLNTQQLHHNYMEIKEIQ